MSFKFWHLNCAKLCKTVQHHYVAFSLMATPTATPDALLQEVPQPAGAIEHAHRDEKVALSSFEERSYMDAEVDILLDTCTVSINDYAKEAMQQLVDLCNRSGLSIARKGVVPKLLSLMTHGENAEVSRGAAHVLAALSNTRYADRCKACAFSVVCQLCSRGGLEACISLLVDRDTDKHIRTLVGKIVANVLCSGKCVKRARTLHIKKVRKMYGPERAVNFEKHLDAMFQRKMLDDCTPPNGMTCPITLQLMEGAQRSAQNVSSLANDRAVLPCPHRAGRCIGRLLVRSKGH